MAKTRILDVPAGDLHPRPPAFLAAILLALGVVLAYAGTWTVPFLFDDFVTLVENPELRASPSIVGLLNPPAHTGVGGRPVANLSFLVNHRLTGDSLPGYHGFNLLIHLFAGLALFGLVRRTLLLPKLAPRFGTDACFFALAVAGLWLLHPINTQSVTYISQRTESLMGMFYFLTLYCFVRGAREPQRYGWLVLSGVACVLGMGTKEVMVTVPVAVLLYDHAFETGSFCAAWQRRRAYYTGLASSWVLLAFLIRGLGGRGVGLGGGLEWWRSVVAGCRAGMGYLALAVWPHPLVFDYGVEVGGIGASDVLVAGLGLGLVGLAVVGFRRCRPLGLVAAWPLLTLAPTSGLVPIPLQPMAENRAYLPVAAVVVAMVLLAHTVLRPGVWRLFCLGVALAFGTLSFVRNADYHTEISLWADTVAKRPGNSRAHHNLGTALRDAGRLAEAEYHFLEALHLQPDYAEARAALGGVVARLGRLDEAIEHCRTALRLDPVAVSAHNNLGGALWQKGDLAGAVAAYEAAVRLRPRFAEAQVNLANVLLQEGRLADAVAASEAALRVKPQLLAARFSLGCALAGLNRLAEAEACFQAVLQVDPTSRFAREKLEQIRTARPALR